MIATASLILAGLLASGAYHPMRECRKPDSSFVKKDLLVTKYYCFENDSLQWIQRLRNGVPDGLSENFYPTGQKSQETPYRNGKLEGIQKGWRESGFLAMTKPYKNDLPIGTHETWYGPGKPQQISHYNKKGEQEGEQKKWWPNGNLEYESMEKQGRIVTGTEYYPDGKPRIKYVYDFNPRNKITHDYDKAIDIRTWSPTGKPTGSVTKGNGAYVNFLAKPDSVSGQYNAHRETYKDGILVKSDKLDSAAKAEWMK